MAYLSLTEDKVAIIPLEDEAISRGGLFLPDQALQQIDQGIVKYVSPRVKEIKVGDHVVFSPYAGTQLSIEGEGQLYIMKESLVEAIINDDEAPIPIISLNRLFRLLEEIYNEWLMRNFGADQKAVNAADGFKTDIKQTLENLTWAEDFEF